MEMTRKYRIQQRDSNKELQKEGRQEYSKR
jgi:hypothetical protein